MAKQTKTEVFKKQQEYAKKTYNHYHLKIRKDNIEVIDKLESVKSKNAYITSLIEKDIEK